MKRFMVLVGFNDLGFPGIYMFDDVDSVDEFFRDNIDDKRILDIQVYELSPSFNGDAVYEYINWIEFTKSRILQAIGEVLDR